MVQLVLIGQCNLCLRYNSNSAAGIIKLISGERNFEFKSTSPINIIYLFIDNKMTFNNYTIKPSLSYIAEVEKITEVP